MYIQKPTVHAERNSNVELLVEKDALLWELMAVGLPVQKTGHDRVTIEEAEWLESGSGMTAQAKNTNQSKCKQSDLVPGHIMTALTGTYNYVCMYQNNTQGKPHWLLAAAMNKPWDPGECLACCPGYISGSAVCVCVCARLKSAVSVPMGTRKCCVAVKQLEPIVPSLGLCYS